MNLSPNEATLGAQSSKSGSAIYEPTDADKKTIKVAQNCFDLARRHKAQYDEKFLDYYKMFRGKQWEGQRPSYRHTEVVNLIFRTIQSNVPIQVDARPKFEFLPEEPSDLELANILNEISEADWLKYGWSEQLLEVIYDANIYGTGFSTMPVKMDKGQVRIVYESFDPFYAFPAPEATDVNKNAPYFCTAVPTDVRKVRKMYPDMAEFINADMIDLLNGSKSDLGPMRFRSPVEQKVVMEGSSTPELLNKDRVLVITAWISPEYCEDDFDEVAKTAGEKTVYTQVNRWPNGRKIVIANGILLEDSANGYDDGKYPYQRYPNYLLPREFWGMSEVEQLSGPQKTFNKLVSFALDVLTLTGNPIWKVHGASGVDPDNLVNRPGLVVEWDGEPHHEPRREEGVQLQPFVLQLAHDMEEWFNSVSGSQDVSRGATPTGVTAASAIGMLQEASQTRLRQKQRNLDVYMQQVGEAYASRIFQFVTAPQVFRITAKDGANKYFKLHVEDFTRDDQTPGKRVVMQNYAHDANGNVTGQIDAMATKVFEMRASLDVRVSSGSSLPFEKAEKEQKMLDLYNAKAIDQIALLEGIEFPNWQQVVQRMQKEAAAQAAAQQQVPTAPPAA